MGLVASMLSTTKGLMYFVELSDMQVCMHIWVVLAAEGMIWSHWPTPWCFSFAVACLGKVIR
jgi:hypothetical protein